MEINIENLTKIYKEKKVLGIDKLLFESGKLYGIIGSNGAGKTTMLKIIAGIESYSTGKINYNNIELNDKLIKDVTYMSQKPYLLRTSVFNNIAYPLKIRKYSKDEIEFRVNKIIKELGLCDLKEQLATSLSGGEAQKVALARAIVFEPKLLLLDEPTSNINPSSVELVENLIKERFCKEKMTTIMVTHNIEQANRMCERIISLNKGKIE